MVFLPDYSKMRSLLLIFCIGIVYGAPAAPKGGLCEVCHLLVAEVQDLLTTGQTQGAISDYINSACTKLPSEEKDVCNGFVKDHSGTLFHRLIKDLTPHDFCGRLTDVCPAYSEEPEVQQIEEADDPTANPLECELCKLAVLGIDKLIKENRSSAAINGTLEKFCEGLPAKLKDVCIKVEPAILKGLSAGFDPKVACKFATLCAVEGSESFTQIPCDVCYTVMDAIGIKDTESICASQTSCIQESEAQRKREAKPEVQDTLECQICKFAVQSIDVLVGENKSVVAINSTLLNLCNSLPGEIKYSCLNVEPDILKAVIGGIDPSVACDFLKICNDENKVPLSSMYIPCETCKEALEAVAGEEGAQQCYKFKEVCGLEEPQVEEKVETPFCELCQFLVKSVNDIVQTDRSRDNVGAMLDIVCTPLPEQAKLFCINHRSNIIDQVVTGVKNPKQSCEETNICTEHERDLFSTEEEEERNIQEDARCELCKFVIQLLDQSLETNATIATINTTLLEICNALPATYRQLCVSIVPQIEAAVAAGLNPTNTCIASSFCTPTTRLVSIEEERCETCARFVESLPDEAALKVKNGVCNGACRTRSRRSADQQSSLRYMTNELVQATSLKGAAECELCHLFIRGLDGLVGANTSIETVNKTVIEICSRLAGIQLQRVCLQEAPVIVNLLKDGIDPNKTCIEAKLCTEARIKKRSVVENTAAGEKETFDNHVGTPLMEKIQQKQKNNVGDIACDICEGVVELLDRLIEENATDEKINQTLYQLCSGLPGSFKDLCLQEAPQIMTAVENGFDPKKTCELAKLCTGVSKLKERGLIRKIKKQEESTDTKDTPLMEKIQQKQKNNVGDIACDICEGVVELLDRLIEENATDEKINQTLYQLCSGLPGSFKDVCLQEAPQIMTAVENGFDPKKTCELAKLCTGVSKLKERGLIRKIKKQEESTDTKGTPLMEKIQQKQKNNVGDIACDICEGVVELLDRLIEENATDEKINQTLYQLCSGLPGSFKDLCLQEAPQIMTAVENGFDPKKTCELAKLCTEVSKLKERGLIRKIKKQEESTDTKDSALLTIINKQSAQHNVGDLACDVCEGVVQLLDGLLEENATEEKINQTLYQLCSGLPSGLKDLCLQEVPPIMNTLEQGFDPEKTCQLAGLCTGNGRSRKMKSMKILKRVHETLEDTDILSNEREMGAPEHLENLKDLKCDVCKAIIEELDSVIMQNGSIEKINETLYEMCADLPGALQDLCLQAAPQIVDALKSGVDPAQACANVGLCSGTSEMTILDTQEQEDLNKDVGDAKCDICELIIQGIDEIVGTNASQQKINETVYKLCNDLSGTAKSFCVLVAPVIVKAVTDGADPEKTCETLKLCNAIDIVLPRTNTDVGDVKCEMCELIVHKVDEALGQNASKQEINSTIYKLCNDFTGATKLYCLLLAPAVVKTLEEGAHDPLTACQKINLCPNDTAVRNTYSEVRKDPLDCNTCITSLESAYDDISGNYMKVQRHLLKLCSNLPVLFRNQCEKLVQTDQGRLYKLVLNNYTPTSLCEMAKCQENEEPVKNISS